MSVQTRVFPSEFLRHESVTSHVTRVKAGTGRVMKAVTAIIGSDLDGRQILHDTPQAQNGAHPRLSLVNRQRGGL